MVIIWTELQTMPMLVLRIRLSMGVYRNKFGGGWAKFATPPFTGLGGHFPLAPPVGFRVNIRKFKKNESFYEIVYG